MTTNTTGSVATVFFYVDSATHELQRTDSRDPDYLCYPATEAIAELRAGRGAAVRADDAAEVAAALQAVTA